MEKTSIFIELDDLRFRYERLTGIISILHSAVAELAEVRGLRSDSLDYSLYEVENGLDSCNEELGRIIGVIQQERRAEHE